LEEELNKDLYHALTEIFSALHKQPLPPILEILPSGYPKPAGCAEKP
jgi:hypothetical protein